MKHLKIYESIEIDNLIQKYAKKNPAVVPAEIDFPKEYTTNKDGSINTNNIYLIDMNLTKIPIKFNRVNGNFFCFTFTGVPKLTTLENCPKYVSRDFNCSGNELTTLLNGPIYVGGKYSCHHNNLKDVYGFPEHYIDDLSISYNPVCELLYLVTYTNPVKFIHSLNYNNVIRNGNTIILDRLEESLYEIGKENINVVLSPNNLIFKNYKIL